MTPRDPRLPLSPPRRTALRLLLEALAPDLGLAEETLASAEREDREALWELLDAVLRAGFELLSKLAWRVEHDGEPAARAWLAGDLLPFERIARDHALAAVRLRPGLLARLRRAGPPPEDDPVRLGRALFRLLQRPETVEQAFCRGGTAARLDAGLARLRELGQEGMARRLEALRPAPAELRARHTSRLVPARVLTRPDGTRVEVGSFLITAQPAPGGRLRAARESLRAGGWRLPRPEHILAWASAERLPAERIWLRPIRRRGGRLYGAAVDLRTPGRLLWLPAHLPGPGVRVRGVLELARPTGRTAGAG